NVGCSRSGTKNRMRTWVERKRRSDRRGRGLREEWGYREQQRDQRRPRERPGDSRQKGRETGGGEAEARGKPAPSAQALRRWALSARPTPLNQTRVPSSGRPGAHRLT